MPWPITFASSNTPDLVWLDENFAAVGITVITPGAIAGTNTLTFTPAGNTPTIAAYQNYQLFSGLMTASNTGAVTFRVGGLAALPVYKASPSGPIPLSGGELIVLNYVLFAYDSFLNSGGGGFQIVTPPATAAGTGAASTITNAAGVTLTAAQMTGAGTGQGLITRAGATVGSYNDASDTAAHIIAALPGQAVGSIFRFRVENTTGNTQTLTTGTGITLVGPVTTAAGASHDYIGIVTGGATVTIYG